MFRRLKAVGGIVLAFSGLVALAAHYVKPGGVEAGQTLRRVQLQEAKTMDPVVVTKITRGYTAGR